jgi:2-polyprenyl-3-methyl-5-hydroxy-6-metoxy-1,4-benzoquinol methylase
MKAIGETAYTQFEGIDISPKSVEMTRDILESGDFGTFSNYALLCQDFLNAEPSTASFDALVMGEVLEHVEDPGAFLRRIRELTRPDSYIYISTCMNAPAVDHLALFTSAAHLESIIEDAGLRIADQCLVPYQGLTVTETEEKQLPMNIGAVLAHA